MTQLVPLPTSTEEQLSLERVGSIATHELVFQASKLPPLGHKSFYVQKSVSKNSIKEDIKRSLAQKTSVHKPKAGEDVTITNEVKISQFINRYNYKYFSSN